MSQRSRARKYCKIFKPLRQMHNRKFFMVKLGLPIGDINHNGRIYPVGMFDKVIEDFREKNKDVKFIRPSLDHPVKAIHINVNDLPLGAQELMKDHASRIQGSFSIRSEVPSVGDHVHQGVGKIRQLDVSTYREQFHVEPLITSKERKEEIIQTAQQGIVDAIRATVKQRMIESKLEEANKAFEESVASGEYDQHFAIANLFAIDYKTKYDVLVYSVDATTAHMVSGMYLPDHCPRGSHLTENSLGHQACLEYLLKNADAGARLVVENLLAVHVEDQYFICQLCQIVSTVTCDKHFDFFGDTIKPRSMGKTVSVDLGDNNE